MYCSSIIAMKNLQVHVILLTLTWIHASDLKSSKVLNYTGAEEGNAQLQPNTFVKKYTNDIQSHRRSARLSTSRNTDILRKPQNDQNVESSRPPARRLLKGQRPVPHRKPSVTNSSPAQEPNFQSTPLGATSSINILAGFAGKNRVLVISAPNDSDGYYRLMMNLLKPDVYCEMADRHMQQIIMFHDKGKMGGKVRRVSNQGSLVEEPLDPALVPRLMGFLKLEDGKFGMVLLRKSLQVEERYPYPVQLEAIYEAVDQAPMRRLEKARQKGFVQKCKTAGVEGQVVQSVGSNAVGLQPQMNMAENTRRHMVKPVPQPTQMTQAQISTTIITTTMTTTTKRTTLKTTTSKPTITTTAPSTTIFPSTTTTITTNIPTTVEQTHPHTTVPWHTSGPNTSERVYRSSPQNHLRDTTTHLSVTSNFYKQHKEKYPDHTQKISTAISPTQASIQKPKDKLPVVKHGWSKKLSQHSRERDTQRPTANKPETELMTSQKGKNKPDSADRRKKMHRPEKPLRKIPAGGKDSKVTKETNVSVQNKKVQKPDVFEERAVVDQAANPKKSLDTFLSYFQRRRRIMIITAPDEQNHMYSEQRDEYLEQVCDMALRKMSIISIFGPLTNSTMKIEHYQTEQDRPLRGLPDSDLINQDLITAFRKHFGMIYNDFNMVLTDFDMKVKQRYEVPIVMKAVLDYIDTLSTRIKEIEQQRKLVVMCKKEDKLRSLEDFLSRFRWRRRLFVISTPTDEEWAYQQQLYTINSQACNLGLRHISLLKLVGKTLDDMSGVLELYPINGSVSVDREDLSASLVQDIRNYFQISQEYFSMLLVGKDGNVKSWYPSPMWSMSIIYELVDSMQLRRQEMAIQQSLGMRCPDDEYSHHDGYHEGYHRGYGY
ncbi:coiled-coil domain-containing protein 80 [Sinocyclocheilus grahami]|uniref:Coiled-coil domain-containing protein 80 n=1 Tax=Sinocyclocheilus grahami TaxID=75366 RepID=A0A672M1W0_SINGR|nr:PREDICTED: coiled-coil domain-containing protein 80-like [Sinocyclocheilus grahami]